MQRAVRSLTVSGRPRSPPEAEGTSGLNQTLRVTPAMEAGVSDHVWSVEEVVGLLGIAQRQTAA